MANAYVLPPTFQITIKRKGFLAYQLKTSQVLPVSQKDGFAFFQDPLNLSSIIPDWVDFHFMNESSSTNMSENAEFDYTLKWFGIPIKWRSRITDYIPPVRFTDTQIKGPYTSWVHEHILTSTHEGTVIEDIVTYKLPFIALPFQRIVQKQLEDIFSYRALKIAGWAKGKEYVA